MEDELYKSGIIYVNFPENGRHGCDKHCSFCDFNKINYNIEIKPTDSEVLTFINKIVPGNRVQICGAGDPLYNFEKNKDYLVHLIKLIKSKGFRVELVTRYFEIVEQYWDSLLADIDIYSFSSEAKSPKLLILINKLAETKVIRISKIYNFEQDLTKVDHEALKNYLAFYANNTIKNKNNLIIHFRLNYDFDDYEPHIEFQERELVHQWSKEFNCRVCFGVPSRMILTKQLWNNREVPCWMTRKIAHLDMGVPYEENTEEEPIE